MKKVRELKHKYIMVDLFRCDLSDVFPAGFKILPISAEGMQCVFYAVIGSMEAQHPGIFTPPRLEELDKIYAEIVPSGKFELHNTNYYTADQYLVSVNPDVRSSLP